MDFGAGLCGFYRVEAELDRRLITKDWPGLFRHAERTVAVAVRAHEVMAHHLPEDRLPFAFVVFFADAKGW